MPTPAERALSRAIRTRSFERVYYLYGDEEYLAQDAMRQLVHAAAEEATRDFNVDVRSGGELAAAELGSLLATPPMMAARRVVAIRGVAALAKDAREVLARYLDASAADVVLVLSAAGERRSTGDWAKLERRLRQLPGAVEFAPLTEERLPRWIAHHARTTHGTEITDSAAGLLASAVGNDLPALAAELDKLASYTGGAAIDDASVSAVVGVRRGETLGDFLDAVATRDAARALGLLPHVLAQPKATAVAIVMALATQTLALGWGSAVLEHGGPPPDYFAFLREAGSIYTGRPWGDAARAWARSAAQWTPRAVDDALDELLAADIALKETRLSSDEHVLATVVLALCAGARRNPPAAPGVAA